MIRWLRIALLTLIPWASANAAAAEAQVADTEKGRIRLVTVAAGLEHPWSVAFLPGGDMLVTERPGRLLRIDRRGAKVAIPGVPGVAAVGQGGLLDVVLAPDFSDSRQIFLSFAEPRDGGNGTTVARAVLAEDRLVDIDIIFRQSPTVDSPAHFGSRLVFAPDGNLFVTLGERAHKHFTIRAQDLETHFGKIVRITRDGGVPADNPFLDVPGAQPEIWSYGHRNVQGAAVHPETGLLWATEHGPKGGDELNLVRAGANYGWPLVTHGVAYNGDRIGIGSEREGIRAPVRYWVPSIGTSGLTFYSADKFPQWKGNAFVGGLYGVVMRLELDGERVVHEEPLLQQLKERIRDIRQGPDGLLYVLTDSPKGRLVRIEPAR